MFRQNSKQEQLNNFKENGVTIHIWTSEHNIKSEGIHFGAVTLELSGKNKKYISFNSNNEKIKIEDKSEEVEIENDKAEENFNTNFDADLKAIGRKPNFTFCFYTLDQNKILEQEKEIKKENDLDSKYAARYIWSMLEAAGIKNYISHTSNALTTLKETGLGKLHAKKGLACGLTSGPGQKITTKIGTAVAATNPIAGIVASVVKAYSTTLAKFAPKEVQEHPGEAFIHGNAYAATQLFHRFGMNPDALVSQLQIAKEHELKFNPLTADIKNSIENTGLKSSKKSKLKI